MGEKRMENCFDVNDSYGDKILGIVIKKREHNFITGMSIR